MKKKNKSNSTYEPVFKVGDYIINDDIEMVDSKNRVKLVEEVHTKYTEKNRKKYRLTEVERFDLNMKTGNSSNEFCDEIDRRYKLYTPPTLPEGFDPLTEYDLHKGFESVKRFRELPTEEQIKHLQVIKDHAKARSKKAHELKCQAQSLEDAYKLLWRHFLNIHGFGGKYDE